MNRMAFDNALLFAARAPRPAVLPAAEAVAWMLAYGAAIGGLWYVVTAARATGYL
jgi:hypothetical protein